MWYLWGNLTNTYNQLVIKFALESKLLGVSSQGVTVTGTLLPLLRASSFLWGTFLVALRKWCVYSVYEEVLRILDDCHLLVWEKPVSRFASGIKKLRSKYPKVSRVQRLYWNWDTLFRGLTIGIHVLCGIFLLLIRRSIPRWSREDESERSWVGWVRWSPWALSMLGSWSYQILILVGLVAWILTGLMTHWRDKKYNYRKRSGKKF